VGFSTSRLLIHRDKFGVMTPGALAAEKEVLAISRPMARRGRSLAFSAASSLSMAVLYGSAGCLTTRFGGSRPGQGRWRRPAAVSSRCRRTS
jgi:hypothetical protein